MTKATQEKQQGATITGTVDQGDAGIDPWLVTENVADAATDDVDAPAVDTAAIVSYPAAPTVYHVLSGIAWSYNAAPTGGNITIVMNGSTVFNLDVTVSGPGFFPFPKPKRFGVGDAVTVTLAAAGGAVTGKVSVLGHWTE